MADPPPVCTPPGSRRAATPRATAWTRQRARSPAARHSAATPRARPQPLARGRAPVAGLRGHQELPEAEQTGHPKIEGHVDEHGPTRLGHVDAPGQAVADLLERVVKVRLEDQRGRRPRDRVGEVMPVAERPDAERVLIRRQLEALVAGELLAE